MADRIVVLNGGRMEQAGTPLEVYNNPVNVFVAGFIGSPKMNLLPATVTANSETRLDVSMAGGARLAVGARANGLSPGATVTVGLRPEALHLAHEGPLAGEVKVVEHLGDETLVHVDVGGTLITVKSTADEPARPGARVHLAPTDARRIKLFNSEGQALQPQ